MQTVEEPVRKPARHGGLVVLGRAAGVGLATGGALGGLVVLTTALRDSDSADVGVPTLFGVVVGSLVGLVTAAPTSVVWMLLVGQTSTTPMVARGVAAGAAAAVVLGIYGVLAQSLDWFGGGCAVAAGLSAYLSGPRVGFGRPAKGR